MCADTGLGCRSLWDLDLKFPFKILSWLYLGDRKVKDVDPW